MAYHFERKIITDRWKEKKSNNKIKFKNKEATEKNATYIFYTVFNIIIFFTRNLCIHLKLFRNFTFSVIYFEYIERLLGFTVRLGALNDVPFISWMYTFNTSVTILGGSFPLNQYNLRLKIIISKWKLVNMSTVLIHQIELYFCPTIYN